MAPEVVGEHYDEGIRNAAIQRRTGQVYFSQVVQRSPTPPRNPKSNTGEWAECAVLRMFCAERAFRVVFHLWLFCCIFNRRKAYQLRHELLGPETLARVKHLDYGSAWFRPDEEGEVLRIRQGAFRVRRIVWRHSHHPYRPIEDAKRARSSPSNGGIPPNDAQIFCDLGIHIRRPTTGRCEGRTQSVLDDSCREYWDLGIMANS